MSDLVERLPRWLAIGAGGDAVRLVPVAAPSTGPDVFCKLLDASDQIKLLQDALDRARGALADISTSGDMTLETAKKKAARVYAETGEQA